MSADKAVLARQKLQEGFALQQQGRFVEARAAYREVLKLQPKQFDALHLSGVIAAETGDLDQAVRLMTRALEVNPNNATAHYNLGHVQEDLKRYGAAVKSYDRAIALKPDYATAYNNRGVVQQALGQFEAAVASFGKAVALVPDYAEAYYNRGLALRGAGRMRDAADSFQQAAARKPDHAAAYLAAAILLHELKDSAAAVALCDKAIALTPDDPEIYNTRGMALGDQHHYREALASYDRALSLKPDYAEALNNRGTALSLLKLYPAAIESFTKALALMPQIAEAVHNRGAAFNALGQYPAAIADFEKALKLKPDYEFLPGALLNAQMIICDWRDLDARVADLVRRLGQGEKASATLPLLAATDALPVQRRAAEVWMQNQCPPNNALGPIPPRPAPSKIRLGYFSMDFRVHAVSVLTAGLFEAHERSRFEVYGFSFGPDTGDAMRKRLEKGFDHFFDVREKSDQEVAALARAHAIDIAIDLGGYTSDSRTGVFALRAAPLQVSYLGFPGTMAAPYIDYIVADNVVIPPADRAQYTEKVAALPNFQANDRSRVIAPHTFTRAELGLPEQGFVFCCFNHTYKITPPVFDIWMRILKAAERSVLFLYAGDATAEANLRAEAVRRGVAPERLVFGKRVAPPEYLARLQACDLFLDTSPYNAGTTTSDALWAGLPVITFPGASFASRMAASLLATMGLPELVAPTPAGYENLAVALAKDSVRLADIRAKIAVQRDASPLFDIAALTRHIEDAYTRMMARHASGAPPDHIDVS